MGGPAASHKPAAVHHGPSAAAVLHDSRQVRAMGSAGSQRRLQVLRLRSKVSRRRGFIPRVHICRLSRLLRRRQPRVVRVCRDTPGRRERPLPGPYQALRRQIIRVGNPFSSPDHRSQNHPALVDLPPVQDHSGPQARVPRPLDIDSCLQQGASCIQAGRLGKLHRPLASDITHSSCTPRNRAGAHPWLT